MISVPRGYGKIACVQVSIVDSRSIRQLTKKNRLSSSCIAHSILAPTTDPLYLHVLLAGRVCTSILSSPSSNLPLAIFTHRIRAISMLTVFRHSICKNPRDLTLLNQIEFNILNPVYVWSQTCCPSSAFPLPVEIHVAVFRRLPRTTTDQQIAATITTHIAIGLHLKLHTESLAPS